MRASHVRSTVRVLRVCCRNERPFSGHRGALARHRGALLAGCEPAVQDISQQENSVSEVTGEMSAVAGEVEAELMAANIATAEAFIDAFYSFDPEQLKPMPADAPQSADAILYYQGWAEGFRQYYPKVVEPGEADQ